VHANKLLLVQLSIDLTGTMITYLVVSDVQFPEQCPSLELDPTHCTTSHKHPTVKNNHAITSSRKVYPPVCKI